MLYKIASERLSAIDCLGIKLDRILIFVDRVSEIDTLRDLSFHHFEFSIRNLEQGTVSHIFFFKNITLELIEIENRELATRYSLQSGVDFVSRTQWRSNRATPFGFVLHYAVSQKSKSRRRCYHAQHQFNSSQPSLKINFSRNNLEQLQEPICYIVPEPFIAENLLDNTSTIQQKLFANRSTMSKLTDIQITLKRSISLTKTVSFISALNIVEIKRGNFTQLELKFCNNQGHSTSLDSIPVTFYY